MADQPMTARPKVRGNITTGGLQPDDEHDVITSADGTQRLVRRKGLLELIRELLVEDAPAPEGEPPVGRGGRQREKSIMDVVDEAVRGADEDRR